MADLGMFAPVDVIVERPGVGAASPVIEVEPRCRAALTGVTP
jgi:hypothetical protein